MRKKVLVYSLLFFALACQGLAQEEEPVTYDTTFWDFGLYCSPDYNYRMIAGSSENGVTTSFLNGIESPRFGFSLGLTVTRPVHKKLSLHTGIIYSNSGYRTGTLQDTVLNLYDSVLYSREYHSAYRYHCIEIPLILRVNLGGTRNARFHLGIGAAGQFCINKSVVSFFGDHKEREVTKAERDADIQGIVNFNVTFPLTYRLSLAIEPAFRYSILGYNDRINQGIKRNLYSAGLGFQLCYKITDKQFFDYYYLHIYKKEVKPNF